MIRALMRLFTFGGLFIAGWLLWQHYAPLPVPIPIPDPPPPLTGTIDRIEVSKSKRRMTVYQDGKVVRQYQIALGFAPEGDKFKEGDGKTPEGEFKINRRNDKSLFHLSLGLDYPHDTHRRRAVERGVSPGGDIFIHGQPNKYKDGTVLIGDWTAGCLALSNYEMEELWDVTPIGTPVKIIP